MGDDVISMLGETPATLRRLAGMMRAYGTKFENLHRDIADDFNRTADILDRLSPDLEK